jgi:hypothetical protein
MYTGHIQDKPENSTHSAESGFRLGQLFAED